MFNVGYQEMIFIGVLALLILGPDRLPGFFRKVGSLVATARRTTDTLRREIELADLRREGLDRFAGPSRGGDSGGIPGERTDAARAVEPGQSHPARMAASGETAHEKEERS